MAQDSASDRPPVAENLPALARNLHDFLPKIQNLDRGLARGIDVIGRELANGEDPVDVKVRTQVAFAVQDTERHLGQGAVPMTAQLRQEMTERATTVPGLQDERMERLLKTTEGLDDRRLVRDIRQAAMSMGSAGGGSAPSATNDKHVEELERRAGITAVSSPASNDAAPPRPNFGRPRVGLSGSASASVEPSAPPAAAMGAVGNADGAQPAGPPAPRRQGPGSDEPPPHPGPAEAQPVDRVAPVAQASGRRDQAVPAVEEPVLGRPGHPDPMPSPIREAPRSRPPLGQVEPAARQSALEAEPQGSAAAATIRDPQPAAPGAMRDRVHSVPSPGDASRSTLSPPQVQEGAERPSANPTMMNGTPAAQPRGGRVTLLHRLAASAQRSSDVLPAQHYVPFGGRVSAQRATGEDRRADRLLTQAETAGRNAVEALETFRTGVGRTFMNKVEAAAEKEPGGVPAVLQEMREGGKHASLRQELDKKLKTDTAFASSYGKAANALGNYGEARIAVADRLKSKNLSSQVADERLQRTDVALGEEAARIPGRAQGKSALEELAEKAAAMLQKAVDKVTSMFRKPEEAVAQQQSRPTPSMSIS